MKSIVIYLGIEIQLCVESEVGNAPPTRHLTQLNACILWVHQCLYVREENKCEIDETIYFVNYFLRVVFFWGGELKISQDLNWLSFFYFLLILWLKILHIFKTYL